MAVAPAAGPMEPNEKPPQPSPGFMWKNLFIDQSPPSSSPSSPKYLEDGTPVVLAPPSIILKASTAWTGHLICHFLGDPPSPAKFFADLNPVWGRNGAISVRRFSEGSYLVYVPSASSKRWILKACLWSTGTVSFTVSEWSPSSSLVSPKLKSAPTLLTLRGVPPQLWSQSGVETIAGGVATVIPNSRASLPLTDLGTAKIRAIVPLGPSLPSAVVVQDTNGDYVRVAVEYGRLPALCSSCKAYGHSAHRCPTRRLISTTSAASDQGIGGDTSTSVNPKNSIGPVKPISLNPNLQPTEPLSLVNPPPGQLAPILGPILETPPAGPSNSPPSPLDISQTSSLRLHQSSAETSFTTLLLQQQNQVSAMASSTIESTSVSRPISSTSSTPLSLHPPSPPAPSSPKPLLSTDISASSRNTTDSNNLQACHLTTDYSTPTPKTNSHIYFSTPSSSALPHPSSSPTGVPHQPTSPHQTITQQLMEQIAGELPAVLATSQNSPPQSKGSSPTITIKEASRKNTKRKPITATFNLAEAKAWLRSLDAT